MKKKFAFINHHQGRTASTRIFKTLDKKFKHSKIANLHALSERNLEFWDDRVSNLSVKKGAAWVKRIRKWRGIKKTIREEKKRNIKQKVIMCVRDPIDCFLSVSFSMYVIRMKEFIPIRFEEDYYDKIFEYFSRLIDIYIYRNHMTEKRNIREIFMVYFILDFFMRTI